MKGKIVKIICLVLSAIAFLIFMMSCSGVRSILGWRNSDDSRTVEISRFLSNVRPHPGNPDSHYLLACYYQERGKHKEAIEEFKKVLSIDPNCAKAYNGIGVSFDMLGDFSRAIEHYHYALKLNPNIDYVYNNLGYSYLLQGNIDEAVIALKKATDLNNKDKRSHNNLALAYGEKAQYDLALTEFKLAGDEAKAHYNMAQVYFKKGLYDEARSYYGTALKLNPSLTVVRTGLKAADALVRIFEPISGKVEPKQLIIPDVPKEMPKAKNQIPEEIGASHQQSKPEKVNSSYNIPEEYKNPLIDVSKLREVPEAKEIKKDERVNRKIMETSPLVQTSSSGPEKVHSEPSIATLPSQTRPNAAQQLKKAKEIVDISLEDKKDSITYNIVGDGRIGDYDVFKLDSPSRLVLDIWEMGNRYDKTGIWLDNLFIKAVRIGHYPDKMRFVFDSSKPQLPPYQVDRVDHKLMVSFGNVPQSYESKIYAKETRSPEKEATSRNGKLAIEISNGNGVYRMARTVGDYLKGKGFTVTRLTNADYFNYGETKIFYQKEYHDAADQIADQLPVFRSKEEKEKFDRPNIKIKILIGKDLVPHKKSFENGDKS